MKSNSIKVYDKFSCLWVEMTINDPKEFKVYKDVHHENSTAPNAGFLWENPLPTFTGMLKYPKLQISVCWIPCRTSSRQRPLKRKSTVSAPERMSTGAATADIMYGQRILPLLFEAVSEGKYLIRGFTNRDIRHCIGRDNPDSAKVRGKSAWSSQS